MYLTNATILNDGSIEDLELEAPFNEDGSPKPIILVGSNGSGKTTFMSILSDALVEMAANVFRDVAPSEGNARSWYRILGNKNQRTGSAFSVSALKFRIKDNDHLYRAKCGKVSAEDLKDRMSLYPGVNNWPEDGSSKAIRSNEEDIKQSFLGGCCVFFPVNRHEIPHWLNTKFSDQDSDGFNLQPRFSDRLDRAIIVDRALDKIKPWVLDVLMDQSVDVNFALYPGNNPWAWQYHDELSVRQQSNQTKININTVLKAILGSLDARVVSTHRSQGSSRLGIAFGDTVSIPSFDHLSAGQSTLLSIFLTIIRYADMGHPNRSVDLQNIEGIVLIDEVDAHLHTDLQYNALPKLIKLFPKVQFIMTTHAPLFLLGMKNEFGDHGFQILEMPSGLTIDAERFSEFKHSFDCYKETKAFEDIIANLARSDSKPLLLTEGEFDVDYIKAAIEILGFDGLAKKLEIDWIGNNQQGKAVNGGSSALDKAAATLKHNPSLTKRRVILLYDCDTKKNDENEGLLSIIGLPQHDRGIVKNGIENMFPQIESKEEYFVEKTEEIPYGTKTVNLLDKSKLRDFLCDKGKTKTNYKNFNPLLKKISKIIEEDEQATSEAA